MRPRSPIPRFLAGLGRAGAVLGALAMLAACRAPAPAADAAAGAAAGAQAQAEPFDVKAHYDKREERIAMRDGVKLHTVIYSPKDTSKQYPILMQRTPYSAGPYGADAFKAANRMAPSEDFLRAGYIFVFQDGRGTWNSEGEWANLRPPSEDPDGTDETTDAWDSIDWLVKNLPNNNGRVGQWGISHPGWYTVMGMASHHPALKAASPQASTYDAFIGDDDHRNGAFNLLGVEWWYQMSQVSGPDRAKLQNDKPHQIEWHTPWNYQFFLEAGPIDQYSKHLFNGGMTQVWQNIIDHPDYDDYWKRLNVSKVLHDIKLPVLNVMGWFDSPDPYGAIATYHDIEQQNPDNQNTLVGGPWIHGGWARSDGSRLGDIHFGDNTAEYFQKQIVFPFFEYYLKDQGQWNPAEATMFETGGNRWHRLSQWPPRAAQGRNLYLHAGGRLSFDAPADADAGVANDSYLSDPNKPVPYTAEIRRDDGVTYRVEDQRFAWTRPDVLSYQTDALTEDVTIAGPIPVGLFASTTGTDSDWVVKLIDVYPGDAPDSEDGVKMGGYQMLVGTETMRGKYRNDYAKPEPMVPDQVTPIRFEIRDKFHTFRKGHRIMVQVQSSWFPMIDRNPQVFTDIYKAKPEQFQRATQKVYRSSTASSHVVLPVVQGTLD